MSIMRNHPLSAPTHHPSFDLFCHRRGWRHNHRLLLHSKMKTEPYRNRGFFLKTEPKSTDLAKCEAVTTLLLIQRFQFILRYSRPFLFVILVLAEIIAFSETGNSCRTHRISRMVHTHMSDVSQIYVHVVIPTSCQANTDNSVQF